jgi:hypothetical protein
MSLRCDHFSCQSGRQCTQLTSVRGTDHTYNRPYGRHMDGLSTYDPWEPTSQIMWCGAYVLNVLLRTYVNYLMIYNNISINEECLCTGSIVGTQSILLTCVHESWCGNIRKYKEIIIHNLDLEESISSRHYLQTSLCHRCGSLRHCTRHNILPIKKLIECNLSWVQPILRKNELWYNIPGIVHIRNVILVKCVNNMNIPFLADRAWNKICL